MRRVKNEIIKRNAKDYIFPTLQQRVGKKYANEEGILHSIEDVEYFSKKAKKMEQQAMQTTYAGLFCCLFGLWA